MYQLRCNRLTHLYYKTYPIIKHIQQKYDLNWSWIGTIAKILRNIFTYISCYHDNNTLEITSPSATLP